MHSALFLLVAAGVVFAQTYTNPVVTDSAPDPGVLYYGGYYYAVTTSGDGESAFPIRQSSNLVNWTQIGYVFPDWSANKNPPWAVQDFWAPEIHLITDNSDPSQRRFNVYYTARAGNGLLSIGVATSTAPTGPFKDLGKPIYQNASEGVIDPTFFRDQFSKTPYLVWKVDGNAHGNPTPIYAAEVAADGMSVIGSPVLLISNNQAWEGAIVEGPWVFFYEALQYYYLFYSGNGYASSAYAVGVARSKSALGPYSKLSSNPILHTASSGGAWAGPGHCSVLGVQNQQTTIEMVYHSWPSCCVGTGPRQILLDVVDVDSNGWPNIRNGANTPSQTPQPVP